MTFKNQKGFSHLLIIPILLVLAGIGFAAYRVTKNNPPAESSEKKIAVDESEPDIVLQNIGIDDIDSIDINDYAVREFDTHGLKGFYVFGDSLSGGRLNPNFEFSSLKDDTKVVSAIDGVVTFIKEQSETSDFEVFVQPKDGSAWTVGYDHLVNVVVTKDQTVKAGDTLGEPAVQNNGLTRFEMQINKDVGGETTHYCPTVLLDIDVKSAIEEKLLEMQRSWESVTGKELYDTDAQDPIGCLKTTLTPSEAEGN